MSPYSSVYFVICLCYIDCNYIDCNSASYGNSMIIGCRSVAKTRRNILFVIKIFIVFCGRCSQVSCLILNMVLVGLGPTGVWYQAGYKADSGSLVDIALRPA